MESTDKKPVSTDNSNNERKFEKKPQGNYSPRGNKRFNDKKRFFKKKVCYICANKIKEIDYKNIDLLKRFVADRGKILPRRITGTCAKHQRLISKEIKRARIVALLPFEDK